MEYAGYDVEIDAGAGEGVRNLRNAADGTIRKPFARVGVFVIQCGYRLQIQHQHRTSRLCTMGSTCEDVA